MTEHLAMMQRAQFTKLLRNIAREGINVKNQW